MAAGQAQIVAQEIDQRLARLDALGDALAVDGEGDVDLVHHRASISCCGDAAQQHAGEMFFHRAGRLHVVGRIEIERGDRGIDIAARQRGFRLDRAHRRGADAEIGKPHVGEALAVGFRTRRQPDDRVVAVPPRQFGKAGARVLAGGRHADGGEHLVRRQRGLEQALEEILCLDGALALRAGRLDFAVERQQAGRQFGGRVGKGDGAAERAAVADRRVADMRHGARDQRRVLGDDVGALGGGVARQCADLDHAVFERDAVEAVDAVDVDQQGRRRQPHVEGGDQALPAGEQARVRLAEQRNGLLGRARLFVGEWRRFHVSP